MFCFEVGLFMVFSWDFGFCGLGVCCFDVVFWFRGGCLL